MKILTHDKTAHLDDFLACCVILAQTHYPIERVNKPTEEDLNDPEVFVVDFGQRHEPDKRNFDHHQIKGGNVCAFTQVLEYYNLRDYDALPWIKFVETWDHSGPVNAMKLVGGGASDLIHSPIQQTLLDLFSNSSNITAFSNLGVFMNLIGRNIIDSYEDFHKTMKILKEKAKIFDYNKYYIVDYRDCPEELNKIALKTFEQNYEKEHDIKIEIILNRNFRGESKFRMIRRNDDVNFSILTGYSEVTFVHQSGFLVVFDCDYKILLDILGIRF